MMFDVVIRFSVYVDFVLMIQMQAIYLYFKLFFPSLNTFFYHANGGCSEYKPDVKQKQRNQFNKKESKGFMQDVTVSPQLINITRHSSKKQYVLLNTALD